MSQACIDDLSIVIPAAGLGARLGLGPKALLQLDDRSLLYWVSAKARTVAGEVIVAVPSGCVEPWSHHCPGCRVIEGGDSNLRSMAKLVNAAASTWLMNLNVSMPFASTHLMRRVAETAKANNIAGAFLPMELPVAQVTGEAVTRLLPRQEVAVAQGPNAYRRDLLLGLIDRASDEDWKRQSFLEIAMRHGHTISTVTGEKNNIKITSREDWMLAQHLKEYLK